MSEALEIIAADLLLLSLVFMTICLCVASYMFIRSIWIVGHGEVKPIHALFLTIISPGGKRIKSLNEPDAIGIGVFAAIALEKIGAIKNMGDQVEKNLLLYPDWHASHTVAARYYLLTDSASKAAESLERAGELYRPAWIGSLIKEYSIESIRKELNNGIGIREDKPTSFDEEFDNLNLLQRFAVMSTRLALAGFVAFIIAAILLRLSTLL